VSELLQEARFGFIAYPLDYLCKSGVFAAYAAHGVVPIVFSDKNAAFDGLRTGEHFLDGLRLRTNVGADHLANIQHQLFKWYQTHSVRTQAIVFDRLIANAIRSVK
jgi:hypothetical protein